MDTLLPPPTADHRPVQMSEQNRRITETIVRERGRLGSFIRQRVPDPGEAEDILQEVFFEFIEAYRLPKPIEQVGAWLFRVARNRIVDRFRKRREEALPQALEMEWGWRGRALAGAGLAGARWRSGSRLCPRHVVGGHLGRPRRVARQTT